MRNRPKHPSEIISLAQNVLFGFIDRIKLSYCAALFLRLADRMTYSLRARFLKFEQLMRRLQISNIRFSLGRLPGSGTLCLSRIEDKNRVVHLIGHYVSFGK